MEEEYCIYCGCKLQKTTWNRKFCPNCGIINDEVKNSDEDDLNYIT